MAEWLRPPVPEYISGINTMWTEQSQQDDKQFVLSGNGADLLGLVALTVSETTRKEHIRRPERQLSTGTSSWSRAGIQRGVLKIPIYYTGLMCLAHFLVTNNTNYLRYKRIYNNAATAENSTYDGPVSALTAKYYRDVYRRYRDYSVVALAGFYLLQIIDANVFSYMQNFELGDDISDECFSDDDFS